MKRYHVAFIQKEPLSRILSGIKTVEARLSRNRPPSWNVQTGDVILFKQTGGGIVAEATVADVSRFDNLRPADVKAIAELVSPLTGSSPSSPYWQMKTNSRYAVLIELSNVQPIQFPDEFTPKGVMSAWVSDFKHGQLATPTNLRQLRF